MKKTDAVKACLALALSGPAFLVGAFDQRAWAQAPSGSLDRDGLTALTRAAPPASVPLPPRRPLNLNAASVGAIGYAPATPPTIAAPAPPRPLSQAEQKTFAFAVREIAAGNHGKATSLARTIGDPTAATAIEWYLLRTAGKSAGADRLLAFLNAHPDWPGRTRLRRALEQAFFENGNNPRAIAAYFAANPPETDEGRIAHVKALFDSGDKRKGRDTVRALWQEESLASNLEQIILRNYARQLRREDHKIRMDRMFYRDRSASGLRAAQYLSGGQKALAKARSAVIKREGNAGRLLDAVPRKEKADPGYLFARVQWLRRSDRVVDAAQLLLTAPNNAKAQVETAEWWTERRVQVRMLLDRNQPQLAYQVAAAHASDRDRDFADAEFHAGWVALRFLNRPDIAARHFARMRGRVQTPISVARAEYWLGRSAGAKGDSGTARRHFNAAARYPFTYYGQLAGEKAGRRLVSFGEGQIAPALPNKPALRAAQLFEAADRKDLAAIIHLGLGLSTVDPSHLHGLALEAIRLGYPQFAVTIGKRGLAAGHNLVTVAYPLNGVPNGGRNEAGVEQAFVYAIARQESEFRSNVKSPAGALGLMQLMPATAKRMAKETGQRYSVRRLTSDPVYNMSLGSAYIAKRTGNFTGSYIMAAAAYNAGKSRVDTWVGRFGDPRSNQIDPVDWVERIPFSETRNYVQRVMENVQVYRALLNGGAARLQLSADLSRG